MTAIENVSLVREASSPAIYLVAGDTKFWIVDTAEFSALGFRWDRVRVVSDGSLLQFRDGLLHAPPPIRPSDVYFNCRETYDAIDGRYYSNCRPSKHLVRKDVLVAGWLSEDPFFNRAPHGLEDVFYNMKLDAVFLDRMYGTNGLSNALVAAQWPGNPVAPAPLPMASILAPTGEQPGTPYTSWFVPGLSENINQIHPELQAWHVEDQPPFGSFTSHWQGRGPAPTGWRPLPEDGNSWFPFNPRNPEGAGRSLAAGDYVIMRGCLWQDQGHGPGPWDAMPTSGHGGWAEIHPPDWIVRTAPPNPNARLTGRSFGLCTDAVTGPEIFDEGTVVPDFAPTPSATLQVRSARVEIDTAVTDASTFTTRQISRQEASITTRFGVTPNGIRQGRAKGAVLVGWSERHARDEVWVDDAVPPGASLGTDGGDQWQWTADRQGPFSGSLAHFSAAANGLHQHYFWGSSKPVTAVAPDRLFSMVFMDPAQPPDQLMLQFFDGSWEHRVFWGDDRIAWGSPGSPSRWRAGDLPASGEWVRLEVEAAALGLGARPISGIAFTCYGGSALWDYTGIKRAPARDAKFVSQSVPGSLVTGQSQDITVTMRNMGSETWTGGTQYRLGSQSPQDNQNWGIARVELPAPVSPGQEVAFSFRITAPARPASGFVRLRWQMLQEGLEWFGDYTPEVSVAIFKDAGQTTVPDVEGLSRQSATNRIKAADLVPIFTASPSNFTEVVDQTPVAGSLVARGSKVTCKMGRPT